MRVSGTTRVRTKATVRLLNLVVLFAFSVQSFLVQTHLHNLPRMTAATSQVTISAPDSATVPFDADTCLLCQEFVHSGAYLTPAAVAALPPSAAISLLPQTAVATAAVRLVSHIWMGRAPPGRHA